MTGRRHFLHCAGQATLGFSLLPLACRMSASLPASDAPGFWDAVRALYPMARDRTYFNTGGLGPASGRVLDTVAEVTREQQEAVETGHQLLHAARGPVAAFLGAEPEEIAFMRNATEGNATIASGLDLRPGDEVVFESHAHPGGSYAWLARQQRDGIVVKIFEPDPTSAAGNVERLAELITPRTRVVQVSHITAPTGIVMPARAITDLARERGCWFHVDGAQSAGQIPVDLRALGCDSYATSGHKWLGGPRGTGVLYVRGDRLDEVTPMEVGAYSADEGEVTLPDRFAYVPTAQRFEAGTRDTASVAGLAEAVALFEEIGFERIAARAKHLGTYLHERLAALPGVTLLTPSDPALRAGMVTFKTDRVPYRELFALYQERYRMRCRPVSERGLDAVRVSTHLFNSEAECERLVAATRELLA